MKVDDALALLRRGWSIIPCRAGSKIPLIEWGPYQKGRPGEGQVRDWWMQWPGANAAIVTGEVSNLVVVDIDPGKGGSIDDIEEATGLVVKTGGGGWHLYYEHPGRNVGNRAGVRPGIDIRGDGGYVIAPGSLHENGKLYSILSDEPMTTCPSWVDAPVVKDETAPSGNKWLTRMLEHGCAEGERNTGTARIAGYFAKKGIPVDIAHTLLADWSEHHLRPPLGGTEIRTTVYSVYRTEDARASAVRSAEKREVAPMGALGAGTFQVATMEEFRARHSEKSESWLIDGWMPRGSITYITSPPGVGKTWVMTDLAVSVASGKPFLGVGKIEKQGPVLYIQQEDPPEVVWERIALVMRAKLDIKTPLEIGDEWTPAPLLPIYFHEDGSLRFEDSKMLEGLEKRIAQIRPALVVIDPLYAAVRMDDFGTKAVTEHMPILRTWRVKYGCAFAIAHHTKKSSEGFDRANMWGSTFFDASQETGFQIRKLDGERHSVVLTRTFKNIATGEPVRIDFDISTKPPPDCRYKLTVNEASEQDLAAAKGHEATEEKLQPYLDYIEENGPCTGQEVAVGMGKDKSNVGKRLRKLEKEGRLRKSKTKHWTVVTTPDF